jgi:hypothetical protein
VKAVTIEDQTISYPSAAEKERFSRIESYVKEMTPELSQTTFTDYLAKNRESQPLENRFNLKVKR